MIGAARARRDEARQLPAQRQPRHRRRHPGAGRRRSKSGHLGGAAIDVFPEEPETNSDGFKTQLQGLPNVILTPHIGGSTAEAQEAIGREVATALIKFVNSGTTTGAVNFPHVELPMTPGTHRILNVHRNVPGVLRDINRIVTDKRQHRGAGARDRSGHRLPHHGPRSGRVGRGEDAIAALQTNVRTRILY